MLKQMQHMKAIIVDDNQYDVLILDKLIKIHKLYDETVLFTSPIEALEYINNMNDSESAALFLDIMMPELNGLEFIEDLTKKNRNGLDNLSIYLVSSTVDPRDIAKAEEFPQIKKLIRKPVDSEVLKQL
jgi:CheY-like chemotaxis protein